MKRWIISFCLASLSLLWAEESKFRNFLTLDYRYYSGDNHQLNIEEAALIRMAPALIGELRINPQLTSGFQRYLFQGGLIRIWSEGFYSEIAYGGAWDDRGVISHEGYAETTCEKGRILVSQRVKAGFYPETDSFYLAPDLTGQYFFSESYSLRLKYLFGWDNQGLASHTLVTENRFVWNDKLSTGLLLTGTLQNRNGAVTYPYETGIKADFQFSENRGLRWLLNFLKPEEGIWGLQNSLTLDIRL